MNYLKRALQALFLFAIIWLTIQNYDVKANLKLFTKEIQDASVILVIFFSILIGVIITAFFSAWKEFKSSLNVKRHAKENKKIGKDLELASSNLQLANNEIDRLKLENEKLQTEISTLKEILKTPGKSIESESTRYLDF
ncbi:MAG: LapA family protein [Candidatus Delongbacteria bacterium]|nr:LapA family protein [Candidatus Delongbacteria bacterium]MBN2834460.1 LapA family protein [Candidatus Delongbacteria bacterium]